MQLELKRIQREVGTTFVYVTHDQGEAITMSDHIAVMNRGRVEQIGPSAEIYERPETVFVAGFIGETNLIAGSLVKGADRIEIEIGASRGCKILIPPGQGTRSGRVKVSIRPEKIRLGPAAESQANRFEGRVIEVVYQGESSTYTILIADRTRLTVTQQNNGCGPGLRNGTEIGRGLAGGQRGGVEGDGRCPDRQLPEKASARRLRKRLLVQIGPGTIWIGLFFFLPLTLILVYSFYRFEDGQVVKILTLENYVRALSQSIYYRIFLKSLWYGVVVTLAALAIGYPCAHFLARTTFRRKDSSFRGPHRSLLDHHRGPDLRLEDPAGLKRG